MSYVTADISDFTLTASVRCPGKDFAFSLFLGSDVIEKRHYQAANIHSFALRRPGVYRVRGYARDSSGHSQAWSSPPIRFPGFPAVPPAPKYEGIVIVGVNGASAAAAHILSPAEKVLGFLDPTGKYVGSDFIGYPVVASTPPRARLIGHENYLDEHAGMEPFALVDGAADVLSRELHRRTSMELYMLSRDAHLNGLDLAANHVQSFIFEKFNSRIPYLAQIGAGTRFGYNGIGVVIHKSAKIGNDCMIGQNVTLGARSGGNGTPNIGNNVYISPGAVCLGGRIGNNVVVGANSVVLAEIPDNCVVAGAPARIISTDIDRYTAYTAGRQ